MYSAALVNDPFRDPGVYVKGRYRHESLLFDLGGLHRLPPRKLLKVDHIFVSHTHKDHSIGFDHLLRLCLGRDTCICQRRLVQSPGRPASRRPVKTGPGKGMVLFHFLPKYRSMSHVMTGEADGVETIGMGKISFLTFTAGVLSSLQILYSGGRYVEKA